MWILASGLGMAVIFGLQTNKVLASGLTDSPSNLASAIYAGGSRLAWSLAVAWVIFACCRGYGGTDMHVISFFCAVLTTNLNQPVFRLDQ